MNNLGIVGEALKSKIKEVSRRLTGEEITYLETQGIVKRGTGFIDKSTNKFVSTDFIDGIIATYRGQQAVQVQASAAVAPARQSAADPVYDVVSSINDSIEKLFGVLPTGPVPADAQAEPEAPKSKEAEEEVGILTSLITGFKKLLMSKYLWLSQVAFPLYRAIVNSFHDIINFIGDMKNVFTEYVMPFFTENIPKFFDEIKIFFTESLPQQFELFMASAKEAVQSLLDVPKRVVLYMEDYALNFGKDLLGKFTPWLDSIGINTQEAADKLDKKQKQIQKEQQALDEKKKAAEEQKKKEQAEISRKYAELEKKRLAEEAARKKAEEAQKAAQAALVEKGARDWAYSVYTNKAEEEQIPKPYKDRAEKILSNVPPEWKQPAQPEPVKPTEPVAKKEEAPPAPKAPAPAAPEPVKPTEPVAKKEAPTPTKPAAKPVSLSGMDDVKKMIIGHEGMVPYPYKDSLGLWTIGVGHLIGNGKSLPSEYSAWSNNRDAFYKGNNKTAALSTDEILKLFDKDFDKHKKIAEETPSYDKANDTGKAAFIDLTFNMGKWWPKWPSTRKKLEQLDFVGAAEGLRNSKWYTQVKGRAEKIVNMVANAGNSIVPATILPTGSSGRDVEAATKAANIKPPKQKGPAPSAPSSGTSQSGPSKASEGRITSTNPDATAQSYKQYWGM